MCSDDRPASPVLDHSRFRVTPADLRDSAHRRACAALLEAYARDPMGQESPLPEGLAQRSVSGLAEHPTACVWLAFADSVPSDPPDAVGMLVGFLGYSTFAGRPLLNIHDLIVRADRRGRGVGRALIRSTADWARQKGCVRMTLEVRTDNETARRLYRSEGFGPGDHPYEFWTRPL